MTGCSPRLRRKAPGAAERAQPRRRALGRLRPTPVSTLLPDGGQLIGSQAEAIEDGRARQTRIRCARPSPSPKPTAPDKRVSHRWLGAADRSKAAPRHPRASAVQECLDDRRHLADVPPQDAVVICRLEQPTPVVLLHAVMISRLRDADKLHDHATVIDLRHKL